MQFCANDGVKCHPKPNDNWTKDAGVKKQVTSHHPEPSNRALEAIVLDSHQARIRCYGNLCKLPYEPFVFTRLDCLTAPNIQSGWHSYDVPLEWHTQTKSAIWQL